MSAIHDTVLDYVEQALQQSLIDDHGEADPAIAGIVQQGPVQGNPPPDKARITVTIHENDPDVIYKAAETSNKTRWDDEIVIIETGPVVTWARRFSVKARCLLAKSKEDVEQARSIASTLRSRIERTLLGLSFADVIADDGEYVSRGIVSTSFSSEMIQAGGPGSYDYHIKVRFDVLTTTQGVT